MTNAEKFKEVFGFEINEGVCCVYEDDCQDCFMERYRKAEKELDCTEGYWQSEYKEPSGKVEFDVAFWRRQCMESWDRVAELDKIIDDNNTEWKEAIEKAKTEIENKGFCEADEISIGDALEIIDKHTKELI